MANRITKYALEKKAEDVIIMDLRKLTSMTDYFVIMTGGSDLQVRAISDAVVQGMKKEFGKPWHQEGRENLQWVLLDYVDVVAHVFRKDTREFYGLERLWGDAKIIKVEG
jgi:ribosome-associated protein